jgi:hypothetical protein
MPSRQQLDVLQLFRNFLLWTRQKPEPNRSRIRAMIRQ